MFSGLLRFARNYDQKNSPRRGGFGFLQSARGFLAQIGPDFRDIFCEFLRAHHVG